MKYLIIIGLISLVGCSSLTKGLITPQFNAVKADGDLNAVKGDILPIDGKVALEANIKPQIGVGNSSNDTRTNVGGNMTTSNDSKLMQDYITAIKEGNKQLLDTMWWIVKLLIGLIAILAGNLFFVVKALLKQGEQDDSFKEKLISKGA